jgi:hypothetical protein
LEAIVGNPQWDLGVRVFDEAFAAAQPDILDAAKIIPEEVVPLTIGADWMDRWPTISSPKRSRSRFCHQCHSRHRLPRPSAAGPAFRISTRKSRSAPPISIRSPSTRRSARSRISSATE